MLKAARARTLSLAADLRPDQFLGPQLAIVNPPLWEIGHIGWFQEYWCLRQKREQETAGTPQLVTSAAANRVCVVTNPVVL
jgi:iron(II)-dependent oxidoreductase